MVPMTLAPTTPTPTMADAMLDIAQRAAFCQEAYDNYAEGCSRRATHDYLVEVKHNLAAVDRWLNGENDEPVAFLKAAASQEGRDTYRIHYAADALVAALHYILGAEYQAGLRIRAEAERFDPWRYVDGKSQGEAERLRLSDGITWIFPSSVR
jgi:hypothetical protein